MEKQWRSNGAATEQNSKIAATENQGFDVFGRNQIEQPQRSYRGYVE